MNRSGNRRAPFKALVIALAAMLAAPFGAAQAQDFPTKPIRLIVGFTQGGVVDITGRVLANGLIKLWGQPVVVENRPGAGGLISAELVAKQVPADGYTMVVTPPAIPLYQIFEKELRFDPVRDLTHISIMVEGQLVLWTNQQVPFTHFNEMIAYAKANPGKLNAAAPGLQSNVTIYYEGLKQKLGLDIVVVPTKGTAETRVLTGSNQVQLALNDVGTATQEMQGGRARILAVTGARRQSAFPNAPTFGELGHEEVFGPFWLGLAVPSATPAPIVSRISQGMNAVLQSQDAKDIIGKAGMEILALSPQASQQRILREAAFYSGVAQRAGIKPQ